MKKSLIVLVLISFIMLAFVSSSYSAYITTQLTDNDYDDNWPQINNNAEVA